MSTEIGTATVMATVREMTALGTTALGTTALEMTAREMTVPEMIGGGTTAVETTDRGHHAETVPKRRTRIRQKSRAKRRRRPPCPKQGWK